MSKYTIDAFTAESLQLTHVPGFPENSWFTDDIERVLEHVRNILTTDSGISCIQIFEEKS